MISLLSNWKVSEEEGMIRVNRRGQFGLVGRQCCWLVDSIGDVRRGRESLG